MTGRSILIVNVMKMTSKKDDLVITPSSFALHKLDKGEYIELWYFTNDGLDEASIKKTIDDNAMILLILADGSMVWNSVNVRRSGLATRQNQDDGAILEEFAAQKTLLVHQAEQSKSSVGPYDICVINEKVLEDMGSRVYWEDCIKKDNVRDYKRFAQGFNIT
ncbi:hypothetical protein EDB19DRAFT_1829656 [Suillus lakei]|nr:hypothetical protein EDB19DRAFT_1829656 [Suillus lakei]